MKRHIGFMIASLIITVSLALAIYDLATVPSHSRDGLWQAAMIGLCTGLPFLVTILYIMWYQPSWGIQKTKIEKLGVAQKRKRKRQ